MNTRMLLAAASLSLFAATESVAQAALGMPFHHGSTQVQGVSLRGGSDGAYAARVHGVVLGHQLRLDQGGTRLGLFAGGGVGVSRQENEVENVHLRTGVSLSRRLTAVHPNLSVAAMAGGEIFLTEEPSDRAKHWGNVQVPVRVGLGYDVPAGPVTFTPYATSTLAWYREEEWRDEARVATRRGTDASAEAGATLQWRAVHVGLGYSVGEHGFDRDGRLKLSLGLNF